MRDGGSRLKSIVGGILLVLFGLFVANYILTSILNVRDPLIGCWDIYRPVLGFCF